MNYPYPLNGGCLVCGCPLRLKAEAMIIEGISAHQVATWMSQQWRPISHVTVSKHRKRCMGIRPSRGRPPRGHVVMQAMTHVRPLIQDLVAAVQPLEPRERCQTCGSGVYVEYFDSFRPQTGWELGVKIVRCSGCPPKRVPPALLPETHPQ